MRTLLDEMARQFETAEALDAETRADAEREARLLAAAVLDCSPGELAQRLDRPLLLTQRDRIRSAATRRARGEPLAYCAGRAAFRHLVLVVDQRVLIPRPETEVVVDIALERTRSHPGGVAVDIGTGSGAIALSLASEGRFDRVVATDVSTDALAVASRNLDQLPPGSCAVEFRVGVDFAPLEGIEARVIVSNPPYIAYAEASALPAGVRDWEPPVALFAADDGMARYHALLAEASLFLERQGVLVLEVDTRRAQETARRAESCGFGAVSLVRDLSGRERVLVATNSSRAVDIASSRRAAARASASEGTTASITASGPEAGDNARR